MGNRGLDLGLGAALGFSRAFVGVAQAEVHRALYLREAEIIAMSEAAKDVVYLRKLVRGLGAGEDKPSWLYTDSKAARDVSYNPEHHDKMKHVQRRHFFVRDMVEKFELEVPFVRSEENAADILTKAMKDAKQFHYLRKILMNDTRD